MTPIASRLAAGIALLAAALAGCAKAATDPVEALVHALASAAEDKDADAFALRLAPDFAGDGGMTRAEAQSTLRRYFMAYDSVGITVGELKRPEPTRVAFRVVFNGRPKDVGGLAGLLPGEAVYDFELELAGEGETLTVRRAAWRPWEPPSTN
ncbi:MAG TPA: hypothetical protein VII13_08870 [Vicinamibacteria bacterium]